MLDVPKIEPPKVIEFDVKQSKYQMVGKLPTRAILCGPSGACKGVLLPNLILDVYRNCFPAFASSVHLFQLTITGYLLNNIYTMK